MGDLISREALLKHKYTIGGDGWSIPQDVVDVEYIEKQPSADAVEVVRCKDCKHRHKDFCFRLGKIDEEQNSYFLIVKNDDYCKWGEKE